MTREQAVRALLAEYESRRASNRAEERRRLAEIDSLAPSVVDALRKREDLIMSRIQKIFNRPADADVVSAELAGRMQALHEEARRALCKLNYPADYLEPVFDCKLCQDRGETGEPPRRWCSCFQRRLVRLLCSDEGMAALQIENFESFDPARIPEHPLPGKQGTQRAHTVVLRDICEQYANSFPNNEPRNLLFSGTSGLGKSFLMNCVAHRVLERGFSVARITAPKLIARMRRYHYSGEGAEWVEQWTGARLLLLDDLGSEPMIENVTIVYLLSLLNDRQLARRHTVISTNFSPAELVQAYTERLGSRLLDTGATRMLRFEGRDLRLAPKG
jgi:DNA replication protein DnaC